MSFMHWLRAHRRSVLFLAGLLAACGLVAIPTVPVSLFPIADFPRIVVTIDAGDRAAEQMVLLITQPIEEAVRRVPGVRAVRSRTTRGATDVSVSFQWGTDMANAVLAVNAALSQTLPTLPAGVSVTTRRMDPTVFPILAYSLRSDSLPATELRDLAAYQLRPVLAGVDGVSHVDIQGGAIEEYHVDVDPARLRALGVALDDVVAAVQASTSLDALGRASDFYKLYLVLADNHPADTEALGAIVVRAGPSGLVRVKDVASVTTGSAPQWIRATADGHDAVLVQVFQQRDGNTTEIARAIAQQLEAFRPRLPAGVTIAEWYNQADLISASAGSVRDALVIGILLAGAILWVFLRSSRLIALALLVVPAALATTVLVLRALGLTFNLMTLGGMAAAVGLVIDDVIVMAEHIARRLGETQGALATRVSAAAWEFTAPLAGSSAATVVIFLPLAFLGGVTGAFFKSLSITMASALVISFLLAWLVVPLLTAAMLGERAPGHGLKEPLERLSRAFAVAEDAFVRRPLLLVLVLGPLVALGGLAYLRAGTGFMPEMDEGGFVLDYRSPPGTSLEETDRLLRRVESIIRGNPSVDTYSRRTGLQLGGGVTEANEGDFFVRLKTGNRAPVDEVMDSVRADVAATVPGLEVELAQLMEDLIGDLVAVPQPIEVKLFGDDPADLRSAALATAKALAGLPGVVDVKDGLNPAGDALLVRVDPVRAAAEGVTPAAVAQQVTTVASGEVAAQLPRGPKTVGVRVWLPPDGRQHLTDVARLQLEGPDGRRFALSRVASLREVSGQPEITRDNLKRLVAVTARISGRDLGAAIRMVRGVLDRPGALPGGVYYALGGLYEQQQIAFRGLLAVLAAAVALVFALLLFLYERVRIACVVLAMPLLALPGVFVGLWIAGVTLNISAMVGLTVVVGIVTEVGVFFVSELKEHLDEAPLAEAIARARRQRLRPILMSALAAVLTLMPLALAFGEGARMQQPLAIAIVAGLLLEVPLVLVVLPALLRLVLRDEPNPIRQPG
ncbi:MAG: efflux RND transporter permease subunit [Proteobacteria bacterium]|nr:efflux RND transporter permease subunit [Pseudomonadota bacterium]